MRLITLAALGAALFATACTTGANPDDLFNNGSGIDGGIDNPNNLEENTLAYFNQVVGDRVYFLVDQTTLTPAAITTLDQQAAWLVKYPDVGIVVEGHADEQGTREYNIQLSARRAAVVRDHLVTRGIADRRLSIIPYGKERPIEVCSEERCWSQNRRSVTVVSGGIGA